MSFEDPSGNPISVKSSQENIRDENFCIHLRLSRDTTDTKTWHLRCDGYTNTDILDQDPFGYVSQTELTIKTTALTQQLTDTTNNLTTNLNYITDNLKSEVSTNITELSLRAVNNTIDILYLKMKKDLIPLKEYTDYQYVENCALAGLIIACLSLLLLIAFIGKTMAGGPGSGSNPAFEP
jgi:hypothetical protein